MNWIAAACLFLLIRLIYFRKWKGSFADLLIALVLTNVFWLAPFVHVYALCDGFLYRHTGQRLRPALWHYFLTPRSFWHSARAMKVYRLFGLMVLVIAADGWAMTGFQVTLSWGVWSLAVGLLGFRWRIKKRHKAQSQWPKPQNEIAQYVDSAYPLLKNTKGFTGEKLFDVSSQDRPHIVWVFLESFRAHNVGALGAARPLSPQFDRLAKEGILFSQFYANGTQTKRSAISALFGIPSPFENRAGMEVAKAPLIGLPDIVKRYGYQTAYFHNGHLKFDGQLEFFSRHHFDVIRGKTELLDRFPEATGTSWGLHDEYLFGSAAEWLAEQKTPSCLVLYTLTNHHPFTVPPHFSAPECSDVPSELERRYLQTFYYTDHCLGQFVEQLGDNVILFITADHGFHALPFHPLSDENVHIPFLLYAKGRIDQPRVIDQIGSHVDLVPTLMDVMGFQGANLAIGQSLMRHSQEARAFFHHCGDETKVGYRGKVSDEMLKQYIDAFSTLYANERIVPKKKGLLLL